MSEEYSKPYSLAHPRKGVKVYPLPEIDLEQITEEQLREANTFSPEFLRRLENLFAKKPSNQTWRNFRY